MQMRQGRHRYRRANFRPNQLCQRRGPMRTLCRRRGECSAHGEWLEIWYPEPLVDDAPPSNQRLEPDGDSPWY